MAEIAERELEKVYKDGRVPTVRVLISAAQRRYDRMPGESEWVCLYRIAGLDEAVSEYAPRTDAIDAIQNALAAVGRYLDSRDPSEPADLGWAARARIQPAAGDRQLNENRHLALHTAEFQLRIAEGLKTAGDRAERRAAVAEAVREYRRRRTSSQDRRRGQLD